MEITALSGASFSVSEGEFVVIMGTSGSGKTTLLNIIAGIDTPTEGEVKIKNSLLSNLNDNQRSILRLKEIGFVFQFFNLFPALTAFENVALPFLIEGKHIKHCENRVDEVLRLVGLSNRKNHKPDELSGGEQQKVAIARALLNDPSIILADEPTGNLDSINSKEVFSLLRKICSEKKKTILLATHSPLSIKYCDRVLFLKDGKISGEEIVANKEFNEDFVLDCIMRYLK